jgi:hypothetical protein
MTICAVVLLIGSMVSAADVVGWNAFVIRNSTAGDIAPVISDDPGGGKVFAIALGGQKAGWGTNNMNGKTVGDIKAISITRDPSVTGWGPYINIWITDGSGRYAVLGNEPSNVGEWTPGTAYNITWDVLKDATAKVYETNGQPFTLPAGSTYTFSDFAGYTIATPPSHWGGTGAPDDLLASSYTAYGVNWIFGDTQSNYVGGYLVSSPRVLSGGITISVCASSAPNGYGSPSWGGYATKALAALENGLAVNGDRSTDPTAYEIAPAVAGPGEIAVTSFKSWRGIVNPAGAFANELGSRMHFGVHAMGDGTQQFALEDLTFSMHSSDEWDSLVFEGDFIGYSYSATRYGINWGLDRIKGTLDDVIYTSGNGATLVDEIVYVGVGNGWWPSVTPELPTEQAAMDSHFDWIASLAPDNVAVTCTYGILSWSGSDTVTIAADNVLKLDVNGDPAYLKPGETVVIDMDALNLIQHVAGVQAILNFSSTYFKAGAGEVGVQAGGGVWNELIYNQWTTGGDLDVAIGVDLTSGVGTKANGTVAKFTLTANAVEGTTQMVFRPDVSDIENTMFSDMSAQPVYPNKVNSQIIVIDGTAPNAFAVVAAPVCTATTTTLTFATTDALAGIDYYELFVDSVSQGTIASPFVLDMSGGSYVDGPYTVVVRAYDKSGNYTDSSPVVVTVDKTAPVISNITASQNSSSVLCPNEAVQGVVDIYVDVVDNGCAGLVAPPTVTVDGISPVTYVDVAGATFHYQVAVVATTSNGSHMITVDAVDTLGNSSSDSGSSICVDKTQITGQVELESFVGVSRAVTFVATGGVTKTWTQTLSFTASKASFVLTNVPAGTTSVSAKANWNLRVKRSVTLDGDGQAAVDFTGASKLRGGDLNGTNTTNILDFGVLKINWYTTNSVADITGDGVVTLTDLTILRNNWFQAGDPQ